MVQLTFMGAVNPSDGQTAWTLGTLPDEQLQTILNAAEAPSLRHLSGPVA